MWAFNVFDAPCHYAAAAEQTLLETPVGCVHDSGTAPLQMHLNDLCGVGNMPAAAVLLQSVMSGFDVN